MSPFCTNPCSICRISISKGIKVLTSFSLVAATIGFLAYLTSFIFCRIDYRIALALDRTENESEMLEWKIHLTELDTICSATKTNVHLLGITIVVNIILWLGVAQKRLHCVVIVFALELISLLVMTFTFCLQPGKVTASPQMTVTLFLFFLYKTWMTFAYIDFTFKQLGKENPREDIFLDDLLSRLSIATEQDVLEQERKMKAEGMNKTHEVLAHSMSACSSPV